MGKILLKEFEAGPAVFLTVTRVETQEDLRETKVFVSIWPAEKQGAVFRGLKKGVWEIQQHLNAAMRIQPVPKISFFLDQTIEEADRVEQLIEETKKE